MAYYKFEIIKTIIDDTTNKPVRHEVGAVHQGPDMEDLIEDALLSLQMTSYYASAADGFRLSVWMRRTVTP